MSKLKDPIRQASLFTMGGLIDPRLMPGYAENSSTKIKITRESLNQFRKYCEEMKGRKVSGHQSQI